MKKIFFRFYLILFLTLVQSTSSFATVINTGFVNNTTTAGSLMTATSNITPRSTIRLDIGGSKYAGAATPLTLTISVDASTPSVTVGAAPDQLFRDDTVSASFFGYYLTTGVRSANQSVTAAGVNIKVQKGAGETLGRSYYLLGNGTITPTAQSSLTIAPVAYTTFASTSKNVIRCGPSYAANGLSGTAINCAAGSTVANMDITQFVKILYSDSTASAVVSQLDLIAVAE